MFNGRSSAKLGLGYITMVKKDDFDGKTSEVSEVRVHAFPIASAFYQLASSHPSQMPQVPPKKHIVNMSLLFKQCTGTYYMPRFFFYVIKKEQGPQR